LTASLPICIPFIPSSCLIALARNSNTMLNRSGDSVSPTFIMCLLAPAPVGPTLSIYSWLPA
jgi:hypothetical protein